MASRRSSLAESINDVAISHARTPSNNSVFSLATPLAFTHAEAKGKHSRHSFLRKLKPKTGKLGGHQREDSDKWEWRCKGEDIENFDWPPEGWHERAHSVTPPLSPADSSAPSSSRHTARDSTGSTASTSSVATWPDEAAVDEPIVRDDEVDTAEQRRQEAELAAIEAIESFFVSKRTSVALSSTETSEDFAIDLSAYDDPECPSTFIEDAPPTPVVTRRPPCVSRTSNTSFISVADSIDEEDESSVGKPVCDFPVTVQLAAPLSTLPPDIDQLRRQRSPLRPTSVQSLPPMPVANPASSRRHLLHQRSPSPVPNALARRPLPPLPTRRRRPSSMLLPDAADKANEVKYTEEEMALLRAQRLQAGYDWF